VSLGNWGAIRLVKCLSAADEASVIDLSADTLSDELCGETFSLVTLSVDTLNRLVPSRGLAYLALVQGEHDLAVSELEQVTRLHSRDFFAHLWLFNIFDIMGIPERAVAEYEQGELSQVQNGPSFRERVVVNYLSIADRSLIDGDPSRAKKALKKVLEIDGSNVYALYHLALISGEDPLDEFELNEFHIEPWQDERLGKLVASALAELVARGAWDKEMRLRVTSFLLWQGFYSEARFSIEAQLAQHSQDPDWRYRKGELAYRTGDYDLALRQLHQVVEQQPGYATAYLRIAQIYERQGCFMEAEDWYTRYVRLRPNDLLGLESLLRVTERIGRTRRVGELRESIADRTDDKRLVAQLLGIEEQQISLGKNLLPNGGFEEGKEHPEDWHWVYHVNTPGRFSKGLFFGGMDKLNGYDGQAVQIQGFWIEALAETPSPRVGLWLDRMRRLRLEPGSPYVLTVYYKTTPQGQAHLYDTASQVIIARPQDRFLPSTRGDWRKAIAIFWTPDNQELDVQPALENWGVGDVFFDEIALRRIILDGDRIVREQHIITIR